MARDPSIAEAMWERISRELDAIEQEHNVRILLAVESGSRAWRFPSLDSDYDVRFIYVRPAAAYLSIEPPHDVIERPTDGVLDINGWDVRKALQLLVRSNAVILEWLNSPIRYRESGTIPGHLFKLARETCCLPALAYHYDRLARHSFSKITFSGGSVRLKTYCYVLRPVLTLLWLRRRGEAPPMDLPGLLNGIVVTEDVRQAIAELVERKAVADEQGTCARLPVLDALIVEILSQSVNRFVLADRTAVRSQANALFASIVRSASSPGHPLG
jgi:uncharacterized protein